MKSFNFFSFRMGFICLLATVGFQAQATTFTLNNNNPTPGQYTTFAAAQTAASAGDTILVQSSPTSYLDATITKNNLTLIGAGHRPNTPSHVGVTFGSIIIANGINTFRIYGIKVTGQVGSDQNVSNVNIENCFFDTGAPCILIGNGGTNWTIKNNVIQNLQGNSGIEMGNGNQSNILISNNYFTCGAAITNFGGANPKILSNNIFAWSGAGVLNNTNMNNTIFENNIFYGVNPNAGTQTNCVYNNNLTYLTANNNLPPSGQSGSNNLINMNPLFVNNFTPPAGSAFNYSYDFRLQAASPAKGTGTNGTDMGVFQSTNVFSMTGEPARPQTTMLNMNPAIIPAGGTTTVNFTIRKSTPNAQ